MLLGHDEFRTLMAVLVVVVVVVGGGVVEAAVAVVVTATITIIKRIQKSFLHVSTIISIAFDTTSIRHTIAIVMHRICIRVAFFFFFLLRRIDIAIATCHGRQVRHGHKVLEQLKYSGSGCRGSGVGVGCGCHGGRQERHQTGGGIWNSGRLWIGCFK
jgi:hypothetical protein